MSDILSRLNSSNKTTLKRKWLPLAATAATFSLMSCSLFSTSSNDSRLSPSELPPEPAPSAAAEAPVVDSAGHVQAPTGEGGAVEPAALARQVQQYTDQVNAAMATTATAPAAPVTREHQVVTPAGDKVSVKVTETPLITETIRPPELIAPAPAVAPPVKPAKVENPTPAVAPPVVAAPPTTRSGEENNAVTAENPTSAAAMAAMTATPPVEVVPPPPPPPPPATMETLLELLHKRVVSQPGAIQYALALQLLESAETAKPANPANLSGLSTTDQKFVSELTNAIMQATARSAATGAKVTLPERAAPLVEAAKAWQAQEDLKLPTLVLASRVDSYGVYTQVAPRFEVGKRHVAIIYCEVANFTSKRTEDGFYQTRLAQQDTLVTEDNLLVWRPNPEEIEDRSHNLRHDFYLVKKMTLPETLAVGKYTLRMSVTDKISNKISMISMPIEIYAK